MRWCFAIIAVTGCLLAGTAAAGSLAVTLADAAGKPVADAVVELVRNGVPMAAPALATTPHIVDQRDEMFMPYVALMRPGEQVVFRNSDKTRHQVYSFSDIKRFEYVLRPGESSGPLTVDKPGVVSIGCNIHDQMVTYLFITTAPAAKISTATGTVVFDDLPAGAYTVHAWHPQLSPGDAGPRRSVELTAAPVRVDLALHLLADPRDAVDREHIGY
jgi:plastocyanin